MHHAPFSAASTYCPPAWLTNPHAQTIYAACLAPVPHVRFRRERWETPDGDFIDLDWATPSHRNKAKPCGDTPLVVLFHGLEGSSRSHYARTIMHAVERRGWSGVVVHFRGCSGEPNRLPRAYHSGDTVEMQWILERLRRCTPGPLCAAAVSLGANVMLKWLGENGPGASDYVNCACAISAPLDLVATGTALDQGFNKLYTWNFLRSLRRKTVAKVVHHRAAFDMTPHEVRATRSLRAFDDLVTARMHGFHDAMDYWSRSSSKPWLREIAVPTFVLNARDDPFLPGCALPSAQDVSSAVTLEFPEHGGHVGFVTGRFPGSLDWLPQRVLSYVDDCLQRQGHGAGTMA